MKKGITLKKLAKLVYNISNAVANFKNVEPTSLRMIETDIEFTSDLFTHFFISINENAAVSVRSEKNNFYKCIVFEVDLYDSKFYAEIK